MTRGCENLSFVPFYWAGSVLIRFRHGVLLIAALYDGNMNGLRGCFIRVFPFPASSPWNGKKRELPRYLNKMRTTRWFVFYMKLC